MRLPLCSCPGGVGVLVLAKRLLAGAFRSRSPFGAEQYQFCRRRLETRSGPKEFCRNQRFYPSELEVEIARERPDIRSRTRKPSEVRSKSGAQGQESDTKSLGGPSARRFARKPRRAQSRSRSVPSGISTPVAPCSSKLQPHAPMLAFGFPGTPFLRNGRSPASPRSTPLRALPGSQAQGHLGVLRRLRQSGLEPAKGGAQALSAAASAGCVETLEWLRRQCLCTSRGLLWRSLQDIDQGARTSFRNREFAPVLRGDMGCPKIHTSTRARAPGLELGHPRIRSWTIRGFSGVRCGVGANVGGRRARSARDPCDQLRRRYQRKRTRTRKIVQIPGLSPRLSGRTFERPRHTRGPRPPSCAHTEGMVWIPRASATSTRPASSLRPREQGTSWELAGEVGRSGGGGASRSGPKIGARAVPERRGQQRALVIWISRRRTLPAL